MKTRLCAQERHCKRRVSYNTLTQYPHRLVQYYENRKKNLDRNFVRLLMHSN